MAQNLLHNVYLFRSMAGPELEAITSAGESQTYAPGDSIFLKGEKATAMYLIKLGSVNIQQSGKSGDNILVATLATGSHFGEMAFVDNETRSATAVAAERCELFVLSYEKLNAVLLKQPAMAVKFYSELAHFLCGRLRVTTSDLSYAREKNLSHF
jgi:CRP/FNR family cyclic AMP-dependent transcriptional regulator